MDPLYQRLKELDPDTFQKLCFHLLKEKYPGADIRSVDGSAGDEGIDMFLGELEGGLTIWQAKSFPNGVHESQKKQIRESLKTARKLGPKKWILCISVDMDIKAHRWFQYIKKMEAANTGTVLDLTQGSDIVGELIHRRSLRNYFFPGAILDPVEMKRILKNSEGLSDEELSSMTEDNVEDFIERLKERDARFRYEVVFDGDSGPKKVLPDHRPGLVFSAKDPAKTINAFARDVEALRQNPPEITFTFKGTGTEKILSFIKTGIPQEFTAEEIIRIKTNINFPRLSQLPAKLSVGSSPHLKRKRVKTRLSFVGDSERVEYSYIEFMMSRAGSEEVEWITANEKLPFILTMVIPINRPTSASLNYRERYEGAEIHDIAKSLRAFRLLKEGCEIELFNLENDALIIRSKLSLTAPPEVAGPESYRLIDDLVMISDRFKVRLVFPKEISDQDFQSISILKELNSGEVSSIDSFNGNFHKTESYKDSTLLANVDASYKITIPELIPRPKLFGKEISTGPFTYYLAQARIREFADFMRRLNEAEMGTDVPFAVEPLCPVRLILGDGPAE